MNYIEIILKIIIIIMFFITIFMVIYNCKGMKFFTTIFMVIYNCKGMKLSNMLESLHKFINKILKRLSERLSEKLSEELSLKYWKNKIKSHHANKLLALSWSGLALFYLFLVISIFVNDSLIRFHTVGSLFSGFGILLISILLVLVDAARNSKINLIVKELVFLLIFIPFLCITALTGVIFQTSSIFESAIQIIIFCLFIFLISFTMFITLIINTTKKPVQSIIFSMIFYLLMYASSSLFFGLPYYKNDNTENQLNFSKEQIIEIAKKGLYGFFNYPAKSENDKVTDTINSVEMNLEFNYNISKSYIKVDSIKNINDIKADIRKENKDIRNICEDIFKKLDNKETFKYYESVTKLVDKILVTEMDEYYKKLYLSRIKVSLDGKQVQHLYLLNIVQYFMAKVWDWLLLSIVMVFLTNILNQKDIESNNKATNGKLDKLNRYNRVTLRYIKMIEEEYKKMEIKFLKNEVIFNKTNANIEEVRNDFNKFYKELGTIQNEKCEILLDLIDNQYNNLIKANTMPKEITYNTNDSSNNFIEKEDKITSLDVNVIKDKLILSIEDLNKPNDINDTIKFLIELANEARLLALNAGIQSRQIDGDNGGFCVISEEFAKLAQKLHETIQYLEKDINHSEEILNKTQRELELAINLIDSTYLK